MKILQAQLEDSRFKMLHKFMVLSKIEDRWRSANQGTFCWHPCAELSEVAPAQSWTGPSGNQCLNIYRNMGKWTLTSLWFIVYMEPVHYCSACLCVCVPHSLNGTFQGCNVCSSVFTSSDIYRTWSNGAIPVLAGFGASHWVCRAPPRQSSAKSSAFNLAKA